MLSYLFKKIKSIRFLDGGTPGSEPHLTAKIDKRACNIPIIMAKINSIVI